MNFQIFLLPAECWSCSAAELSSTPPAQPIPNAFLRNQAQRLLRTASLGEQGTTFLSREPERLMQSEWKVLVKTKARGDVKWWSESVEKCLKA